MENCKPKGVPADPNARLVRKQLDNTTDPELIPYREAVGSLLYLTTTTRPDIAFAVSKVAQHCENSDQSHLASERRIFAYFKGAQHYVASTETAHAHSLAILIPITPGTRQHATQQQVLFVYLMMVPFSGVAVGKHV